MAYIRTLILCHHLYFLTFLVGSDPKSKKRSGACYFSNSTLSCRGNSYGNTRLYLHSINTSNVKSVYFDNIDYPFISDTYFNGFSLALTNLTWIKSHIKDIRPGAFDKINRLRELVLSDNKIKELKLYYFQNLGNIRVLDLNDNHLSKIEFPVFYNGSLSLTKLLLCCNLINAIADNAFSNLPNIKVIDLHSNELTNLNFSFPSSLIRLDLSSNRIITVNYKLLSFSSSVVLLARNPLECDCQTLLIYIKYRRRENYLLENSVLKNRNTTEYTETQEGEILRKEEKNTFCKTKDTPIKIYGMFNITDYANSNNCIQQAKNMTPSISTVHTLSKNDPTRRYTDKLGNWFSERIYMDNSSGRDENLTAIFLRQMSQQRDFNANSNFDYYNQLETPQPQREISFLRNILPIILILAFIIIIVTVFIVLELKRQGYWKKNGDDENAFSIENRNYCPSRLRFES
ncbi:unnamed protein product [Gordionus sp. m RMFG-2023]